MKENGLLKDFWEHIFPKRIRKKDLKITYTLCMGGLCFLSFLVLCVSGIFLSLYYIPGHDAYNSILFIEENVYFGTFLRTIHRYASDSLIIFLIIHVIRVVFQGAFLPPRHMNWIIGCFIFFICFFEAYLGYVLLQDELGVWAFETGMKLFDHTIFTRFIYKLFVVDGFAGKITLVRVFIFHVLIIPLIVFILCILHIYIIRKNKGVLPYL